MTALSGSISPRADDAMNVVLLRLALRYAEHLCPGTLSACGALLPAENSRTLRTVLGLWRLRTATLLRAHNRKGGHKGGIEATLVASTLRELLKGKPVWRVIEPLLSGREARNALVGIIRDRNLVPFDEVAYREALTRVAAPVIAGRIRAEEYSCLTISEQRLVGAPVAPARLRKCLAELTAKSPRYPGAGAETNPPAYILSRGKRAEPPTVQGPPLVTDVRLVGSDAGTLIEVATDTKNAPEHTVCSYVEVDTDASFASPNHLVWPPLHYFRAANEVLEDRSRYTFQLTALREQKFTRGMMSKLIVPLPIELLMLPERRTALTWAHLAGLARRLHALGGTDAELAARAFQYTKLMIWFGHVLQPVTALEVLRSGVAGCGHMNSVGAFLLELCGIRVRGVSGYTPSLKQEYPGGGHSAFEYLDRETDSWCYFDPFLDLLLPTSAAGLEESESGSMVINRFYESGQEQPARERTLAELFVSRNYFDPLRRMPMTGFLEMSDEGSFGRNWELASSDHLGGHVRAAGSQNRPRELYVRYRALSGAGLSVDNFGSHEARRQALALARRKEDVSSIASLSAWETHRIAVPPAG